MTFLPYLIILRAMSVNLSTLLHEYHQRHAEERDLIERFNDLLTMPDAFYRTARPGHFTASALVVDFAFSRVLLVEHRKLGIWVQPGGHADGNTNLEQTARREVAEETGIQNCRCDGTILDLDIHPIPARPGEGAHHHYDVRFLFIAESGQKLIISDESTDLKWISLNEVNRFSSETSISRMISKAGVRLKG